MQNYPTKLTTGHIIRIRRAEMKMSQTELAKLAGVSRNYISLTERDEANITVSTLKLIANALDLELTLTLNER